MNPRIDLLTLQLFIATVEQQSIARAAEQNHIAASALSRRISDLEDLLQVELLHRHSKGIEPTTAGYALLEHARIIMGNLTRLHTDMREHGHGARGHIRIFANHSAILEGLADALSQFLKAHPLIHIDLEENISPAIVRALMENQADLGIFGDNVLAPELQVIPYRDDHLVVVMPLDHALATTPSVRFEDLVEHDFVCLEKGSSIETLCVKAAAARGRQLRSRIRVGGFDALLRLVEAGMGIGLVPREVLAGGRDGGRLAHIPLDEAWARRGLVLGVRDQASLPPATRLLITHLTQG